MTPARAAVLGRVAAAVLELPPDGIVRVGIDGVDGAGKTMFADELRDRLAPSGRPLIRASVDGFHNPKPVRYRQGRASPEGFYRDPYDYAMLKNVLFDPLRPGGAARFGGPSSTWTPTLRSIFLRVEWARNHRLRKHPEQNPSRYFEGQNIYFRECKPWELASIVIDNDDLAAPFIVS